MTGEVAKAPASGEATGVSSIKMGRIARGTSANLAGALVSGFANFALAIAITHGLTRSDAGVFFTCTSVFLLAASIGLLGTDTGLVYFLSRSRALDTRERLPSYLRAALGPLLICTSMIGLGIFVFASQVASVTNPDNPGLATDYLRVLAIFVPFVGLEASLLAGTRGMGTMRPFATVEQFSRPVLQLILVAAAVSLPINGLLSWAWAFAYLPAAVVAALWWRRLRGPHDVPSRRDQRIQFREFWRFTGPRSLASVVQIAMQRFDIVLVAALAGAVPAAVYAAATRFVVAGQMSNNAVSRAIQPHLAEVLAKRDDAAANHLFQISTAWLMAVTWPLYLTFAVFGGPLLQIFGKGYDAGTTVLLLLSVAMLVSTACGDVDIVLNMAGRTSWTLANVSLAFGINLGLDLWLIPSHGVTGAAIGWATAIVLKNVTALVQVGWVLRLHPFGRPTTIVTLLTLVGYAIFPGLAHLILGPSWLSLLVGVGIGSMLFLLGVWAFREPLQLGSLKALRGRKPAPGR